MKINPLPPKVKAAKPPTPPPVALYVARNRAKEIMCATFEPKLVGIMTSLFGKVEKHPAKARTTGAMYGRLMNLTGNSFKGARGRDKLPAARRREIAMIANKARWEKK